MGVNADNKCGQVCSLLYPPRAPSVCLFRILPLSPLHPLRTLLANLPLCIAEMNDDDVSGGEQ